MKTREVFEEISRTPELALHFELPDKSRVRKDYHITELKNINIHSVDCGGRENKWNETVLQVWVPDGYSDVDTMSAGKAWSIIEKVAGLAPIDHEAEFKVEYGNPAVQYHVELEKDERSLTFRLMNTATECKALSYGGTCGPIKKEKKDLSELVVSEGDGCCSGEGCC